VDPPDAAAARPEHCFLLEAVGTAPPLHLQLALALDALAHLEHVPGAFVVDLAPVLLPRGRALAANVPQRALEHCPIRHPLAQDKRWMPPHLVFDQQTGQPHRPALAFGAIPELVHVHGRDGRPLAHHVPASMLAR